MQKDNLKIIIPMAGFGTRLRPHTWSKPKPLVSVAGKAVLGHVLDIFATVSDAEDTELVFIIGYLGEQIKNYMQVRHPEIKTHYIVQEEKRGQSHAIALAREFLQGPTLVAFVDTIIDTDLSILADEYAEAVIWVKEVEDPRRFGVVDADEDKQAFYINLKSNRNNFEMVMLVGFIAAGEAMKIGIEPDVFFVRVQIPLGEGFELLATASKEDLKRLMSGEINTAQFARIIQYL
ncbi:MAG: nucleotidyltransferase family protein [Candidatus Marinimicrobia bacterium]|nr:nucleotidyltransferase family protein [Candidatus Neomarinimicrobiota bacterium]